MAAGARRSAGRQTGRVGVAIAAVLAVAGLVTVLVTHRDGARSDPNSAVIATVTALSTPAGATAAGTAGGPTMPDRTAWDSAATSARTSPPADPTAAVDAAIADAAAQGVRLAVVVVDRPSGAVLVARHADAPYPSLSLLKVMIAADVLTNGWPGSDPPAPPTPPGDQPPTSDASASLDADPALPTPQDSSQVDSLLTRMIATSDDKLAGDLYAAAGGDQLVSRVAQRYGLTGTMPTPDGTYWGNVQVTASDMAALLAGVLADPRTAAVIGPAMQASTELAADGVDQRFGMRLVPGAGSKQGWGCCLSGHLGLHSMGFTDDRVVVVLSAAEPDNADLGNQDGLALQADPGAQASFVAVDAVVRAALGGSAG